VSNYPCRWIKKAERDLKLAELALKINYYEESAFHSQQAAEKALKAILTSLNLRPPKTHDLDILLNILERKKIEVPAREEISSLTAYAVEARYPGPPIIGEEAEYALNMAGKIVKWAKEELKRRGIKC